MIVQLNSCIWIDRFISRCENNAGLEEQTSVSSDGLWGSSDARNYTLLGCFLSPLHICAVLNCKQYGRVICLKIPIILDYWFMLDKQKKKIRYFILLQYTRSNMYIYVDIYMCVCGYVEYIYIYPLLNCQVRLSFFQFHKYWLRTYLLQLKFLPRVMGYSIILICKVLIKDILHYPGYVFFFSCVSKNSVSESVFWGSSVSKSFGKALKIWIPGSWDYSPTDSSVLRNCILLSFCVILCHTIIWDPCSEVYQHEDKDSI